MSMPAGPPARPTSVRDVGAVLDELLRASRSDGVRLLDLVTGRALAVRSARPTAVDPAADAAMARLAAAALPAAETDGGFDDLVLATPDAIHVLAPAPFRSAVVVRLAHGADVGAARRAVRSPRLASDLRAVRAAELLLPVQRAREGPLTGRALHAVPEPRTPEPTPVERQPALATLAAAPFAGRTGELAAQVLAAAGTAALAPGGAPADTGPGIPLPRRAERSPRGDGGLSTVWQRDVAVMQRVLDGLRRMA